MDIKKTFMLGTVIVSIVAFAVLNYDYYKIHASYFLEKISKEEYYSFFNESPTHPYSFRSDYQVADYLTKKSKPGDKLGIIFSAGDTVVHFVSGLQPATRFIQSWYLFSSDPLLSESEITRKLRKEYIEELINADPRFILCVHIPLDELLALPCLRDDSSVEELSTFVNTKYKLEIFPDNRFLYTKL